MVKIFDAELIKGLFIVTDDGNRALINTGSPFIINDENKRTIPMGEIYLNDARCNVDPNISEIRGLEYFAQHKVLLDYRKAAVIVADQGDDVSVVRPVAEFPISVQPHCILFDITINGKIRKMIFDTGTSTANYLARSIIDTEKDLRIVSFLTLPPMLGNSIELFSLPVEIGGETVDIPFGVQPADIDRDVQISGAVGVIGVGLYKNFQVLVDLPNKRLVLGRY